MYRKESEMKLQIREKMRGGKGEVKILHIFEKEELNGKARLCALIRLDPGCSIGPHEHNDEEEIFYFIRGRGLAIEDGKEYIVEPGSALLTGGGLSHSIENTHQKEPLEFMAVILLYN
jgi:mannose-6-phosphate isomerase-like protein (cupin superfamily)